MTKKKKNIIAVSVVVLIILITGFNLYTYLSSKNDTWGIHLSVENVSSTGLTLHMNRKSEDSSLDLSTGHVYWLEKRTLFGWKAVEGGSGFNLEGLVVDEDFSYTWKPNWKMSYGKLSPGIYRIAKEVTASDYYNAAEDKRENIDQIYYATFIVIF